ncbi:MAG: DUF2336 domain-containing protein [Methyloligellaceae bacterium]
MQGAHDYLSKLEQIVSEEAEPNKERLLGTVADLFFLTKHQHTDDDIAIFSNVMEQLAYQLQIEPRAVFADRIADSDRASRRLLLRLATDEIQVAKPVLERSVCITEEDLVEIARGCGLDHLRALSGRTVITPPITDVIVARGDEAVLVRLANNAGVEFSRHGYALLLQHATASRDLRRIVETRGVIGRDLVTRLWLYSMDWRAKLTHQMAAGDAKSKKLVATPKINRDDGTDASKADSEQTPSESIADQKLAASSLLMHARAKNATEIMNCLCALSGAEPAKVQHLMLQASVNAFGIFCRAHKVDSTTFAALLQLRVVAGDLDTSDLIDALRRYDSMNPWHAQQLLQAREAESEPHSQPLKPSSSILAS